MRFQGGYAQLFWWFCPLTSQAVETRRSVRAVRAQRQGHVPYPTPGRATADVSAFPWGTQRAEAFHRIA